MLQGATTESTTQLRASNWLAPCSVVCSVTFYFAKGEAMSSIESEIAKAMMGEIDHATAIARVACNAAAVSAMFCGCGRVLDQRTVTVCTVTTPKRTVVQPFCSTCWEAKQQSIRDAATTTETPLCIESWEGVECINGAKQ